MAIATSRSSSDETQQLAAESGDYELIVTGNGSASRIPLVTDSRLLIGRGEDANLRLASSSVSRRHVSVSLRDCELILEDCGSSNGTLVRGQRLIPHRPTNIGAGESFLVGEFVCVLGVRRDDRRHRLPSEAARSGEPSGAIVHSPPMRALYEQIEPIARSGINVLILGETGVGKDVFACSVHSHSERREKPFLRLNCAAFTESLLESELFGHEKGAFTGATHRKPGLLASASGGTVFLDEIGELPLRLQAKVLHMLETQEVLSVGGLKPYAIDVRFVAATNRDLEREAGTGAFRRDLYYRLAAYTVMVPPLRNRREDIMPLAYAFLRCASERRSTSWVPPIRTDAAALLLEYSWPGNVRELRNVIERALVLSEGAELRPGHLQLETPRGTQRPALVDVGAANVHPSDLDPKELEERQRIIEALRTCAGNQSKAAAQLGVSRSTLINRLDAYRIGRPRKRPR